MAGKFSLSLAVAFGFSVSSLLAAAPSGIYTYNFSPQNVVLWDVSGTYHLSPDINGDIPVNFDITFVQDSKGKLTGAGQTTVDIDGDSVLGNYTVKGKITASQGIARVSGTVKVTGIGVIQGASRAYSLSETFNLEIDSTGPAVTGIGKGSASAKGLGSGKILENINASLPDNMNGDWKLALGVDTSVTKLSGNSTLTLSNDRTLSFLTGGSYSPKTDFSKVKLTGTGEAVGSKLNLLGHSDDMGLYQITGKVFGQTIK